MRVVVRPVPAGAEFQPPPLVGTVVWRFEMATLDALPDALSADERERAERYKLPRVRDQFVRGRGLLRAVLGGYLNRPPASVPIVTRADGKPELAGGEVHFNLSHAAGVGLLAVSGRPVGVDVEPVRAVANMAGLVERFFAPAEQAAFAAVPDEWKAAAFFRGWTCKEALLKGTGQGILALDRCVVEMDPRRPAGVLGFDPGWELAAWEAWPGVAAAVAVQGEMELNPA